MTPTWLPRPAPRFLPVEILPPVLGPVAYQALLRDAVTRRVRAELTVPADLELGPTLRAAALRPLVPDRCVVGRQAAVWVHTGLHEPARVAVLVGPRRRRPDPHPDRVTHECVLPVTDIVTFGDVQVTTVRRTGLDVARWCSGDLARDLLDALCTAGFDPDAALRDLAALRSHRGVRAARTALSQAVESAVEGTDQARTTDSSAALAPVSR